MKKPLDPITEALLNKLCEQGYLTDEKCQTARRRIERTGQPAETALTELGFCPERKIYETLAEIAQVPFYAPEENPPEPEAQENFPQALSQRFHCLPVRLRDGFLEVAFAHLPQQAQLDQLKLLLGSPCKPLLTTATSVTQQRQKSYGLGAEKVRKIRGQQKADTAPARQEEIETDDDANAKDDSVVSLVNEILDAAVRARATDIHLEPFPGTLRIRFRIDGMLQDVPTPPGIESLADAIVSRIKVLAHLDIAEKRLPHDGRIQMTRQGRTRDLRVSILPTRHGETICLRILNAGNLMMDLHELGLDEKLLAQLRGELRRPNGLMLVTGPTGSGKTTTLYSILAHLMREHRDLKIITVEDPVEYDISGMTQVQTHAEIGLTFATTLRSILRHDPDVILVGEIRDRETADIAIQAAMTGHLVLSTLHTSDAVGAINRLINMDAEPDLVAGSLRCVLAQRLVRKLCPQCAIPDHDIAPEDAQALAAAAKELGLLLPPEPKRAAPGGCPNCAHTGYLGRVGVYDLLKIDESLQDLIASRTPNAALRKAAREHGWLPYEHDAYRKVLLGLTDLAEVHRIC